jgi:hypothetical protein
MDEDGNVIGYDKPLIVIMDELTASAGDAFAATIQVTSAAAAWLSHDGRRGQRRSWEAGSYSLGSITVTQSLMNRKNPVVTNDLSGGAIRREHRRVSRHSRGLHDQDNLARNGKSFVDAFVAAMVDYIRILQNHRRGRHE